MYMPKGIHENPFAMCGCKRYRQLTSWTARGVVHAKDEDAKGFYERFRFEPFPSEAFGLAQLPKDLRALVAN